MKIIKILIIWKELINNFLLNEEHIQILNNLNPQFNTLSSSSISWLWIFLFITVITALAICLLTTLIVMSKTKRKIKKITDQQKDNNNNNNNNNNNKEEFNLENIMNLLQNIEVEAKSKNLLNFELIDIKVIKIKIIDYMKKNNIKIINDLFLVKDKELNELILNFPCENCELIDQKNEKFIYFLNQIFNFINKTKEK